MSKRGGARVAFVGDRVLARWPAETDWWYPGVVCRVEPACLEVQFDDGDRSELAPWEAMALSIRIGSRVFGRWQGGPYYYPGVVSEQRGDAIHIEYDDGDEEWTTISLIRVHHSDLPAWA